MSRWCQGPFRCRPAGRAGHGGFRRVGDVFCPPSRILTGDIMPSSAELSPDPKQTALVTLIGDVDATDAIAGLDQSTRLRGCGGRSQVLASERNDAQLWRQRRYKPASVAYLRRLSSSFWTTERGCLDGQRWRIADMERTGLRKRKSPRPDYPAESHSRTRFTSSKATGFERWAVTGLAGRMRCKDRRRLRKNRGLRLMA